MNEFNKNLPYGATPIDRNESKQLIPHHLQNLSELNEFEQKNILKAQIWLISCKKKDFLTDTFLLKLHKKMFDEVWKWAGKYRLSNKNIGGEWQNVPLEVKKLLDNVRYWQDNNIYPIDEIAVRLHHKLVFIHPFSNGNGRHARLYCDTFLKLNSQTPFTWGKMSYTRQSTRKEYIEALRCADNKDYTKLLKFVKS